MTGKSHILFAGTLAWALGYSPPEVACIAGAAVIPDRIERIGPIRILKHRGISHDLILWLFLLFLVVLLENKNVIPIFFLNEWKILLPTEYGFNSLSPHALFLGPVFHLFADALTPMGISLAGWKIRFPLCRTGHPSEFALVALLSLWWGAVGWYAPRLDPVVVVAAGKTLVLYPASFVVRLAAAIVPFVPFVLLRFLPSRSAKRKTEVPAIEREGTPEDPEREPVILKTRGICGREVEIRLEPEGNTLVADLRELRNLWIPASPAPSSETTPKTEPEPKREPNIERTEPREVPQKATKSEAPDNESHLPKDPEGRLKRLLEEYRKDFERSGLSEAVDQVAELLISEGARFPSVAGKDPADALRPKNHFDLLAKVSLLEHSVNTAEKVLAVARRRMPDGWRASAPRLILCALAHDLGKLPSVSGEDYSTASHSLHSAALLGKLLRDHPWREALTDIVKRHHERIDEKTPVELEILIRADKEAREEEAERLAGEKFSPPVVRPETISGKPETRSIPDSFPLERVFAKIPVNQVLPNGSFVAFSQPDGIVYIQAESLHLAISETAREIGLDDSFYHSTEKPIKKSCLQSFYDEIRRRGWAAEKLVSESFYGNFFWVWNPKKNDYTRTFYIPVKADAFGIPIDELEKQRKSHPVIADLRIKGVAPPGSSPPGD
ncbi:metal-dependent phosphohydrolase HD sub domain protein [Thermodesulfatator indicus DSM 15286]|uniref:Metal-dependent phosphohydrolase HD sub domain protein n=1 Tax=Thermodesulfatator indicus (strain DSM 15286 / JCM 11887 / CIR29812) TaxID=667014 RepID=F8ACP1_THEID|nr:HD domain-containing protein [Thermodesulfatator indicus]AEH45820.1 metal-dependent phosphohydrolase HD sub domain protein [Thermodesulfatator indicus DSM 15286]